MARNDEIYNRKVLRARNRYQALLKGNLRLLEDAYVEIITALLVEIDTGRVYDAERARQLLSTVRSHLEQYGKAFLTRVESAANLSASWGAAGHAAGVRAINGPAISFADIPGRALDLSMIRRGIGNQPWSAYFKTVIDAGLEQSAKRLDQLLQIGLARGSSADEMTLVIAEFLTDGVKEKEVRKVISQLGPRGGFRKYADRAIPKSTLQLGQKVIKRSRLIAIHEINSAYHESNALSLVRSRVVEHVRWFTSGRHAGLHSSPDECDVCEQADWYGLGPGIYPVEYVPALLHPRCQCGTEAVIRAQEDWDKARKRPPDLLPVKQSEVGRILTLNQTEYTAARLTPKRIERATRVIKSNLEAAVEAFEEVSRIAA